MKKRDQYSRHEKKKPRPRFTDIGEGIVLDFYPQGKSFSRKRSEDYNPLAVIVTTKFFQFFDVIFSRGVICAVKERLMISPRNKRILRVQQIQYNQLSSSALNILPNILNEAISTFESRYISFLNQAHPLTTQMHQLQLLPGIGHKRLWVILEERKKAPFKSFKDFTEKTGISDPLSMFTNRILTELENSPKYRLFTKIKTV
jgi:putative nucleotide binding protein